MRDIRLLDSRNQLVDVLAEDEARRLIAEGKASLRQAGRRPVLVLKPELLIENFNEANGIDSLGAVRTTYKETHAGHTIVALKRITSSGEFVKWDKDLTFEELRRGQIVSTATRLRREAARRSKDRLAA